MATVTIGSNTYETYADVAQADEYLAADIELSSSWDGSSSDKKSSALVSATRYLDAQFWAGAKTSDSQPLQWPRDGVPGVPDGSIPASIVDSCIVLAGEFIREPGLQSSLGSDSNPKRVKAGSVEVENFKRKAPNKNKLPNRVSSMVSVFFGSKSISYGFSNHGVDTSRFGAGAFEACH